MQLIIKFTGMALILLSGTLIGFYRSYSYTNRTAELKRIYAGMQALIGRIRYGAFEIELCLKECFKDCLSIRVENGSAKAVKGVISNEDTMILNEFFGELGQAVAESEIKRAEFYCSLILGKINEAGDTARQKAGLCRIFGFCGALALCIFII